MVDGRCWVWIGSDWIVTMVDWIDKSQFWLPKIRCRQFIIAIWPYGSQVTSDCNKFVWYWINLDSMLWNMPHFIVVHRHFRCPFLPFTLSHTFIFELIIGLQDYLLCDSFMGKKMLCGSNKLIHFSFFFHQTQSLVNNHHQFAPYFKPSSYFADMNKNLYRILNIMPCLLFGVFFTINKCNLLGRIIQCIIFG